MATILPGVVIGVAVLAILTGEEPPSPHPGTYRMKSESMSRPTCQPTGSAPNNSLHILSAYGERDARPWLWSNGLWCRPDNARWGTKPGPMHTLGWRYVGPAPTQDQPQ